MTTRSLAGCALALLAGACAFTYRGTLTRVPTGAAIPVSVSVAAESATLRGTDPATGERLEGTFHLDREARAPSPVGMPGPVPPVGGGAVSPGTGPRQMAGRPGVLEMKGRLEGDKGTSVRCALQVKRGLHLEGVGVCRAVEGDEEIMAFRIRF